MAMLGWMQEEKMVALGWTLLHFCWQGAAIALVYAVVARAAVRASAKVRYGIAMLALALMPVAAFLTFVEQQRLVVHVPGQRPEVVSHVGSIHATFMQDLSITLPATRSFAASGEIWIASHAGGLLPWVDGLWLAGVLLLTLRAMGGWWQLEQIRRRAHQAVPGHIAASFQRVSQRLRMGRRVMLRISDDVISPLAMGVWRSAVIVPASAILLLPAEQLEAVLAHELAHIRRWDYLCNLLQTMTECLFFFHPAVWWISGCTRDLREVCCDEVAARSCGDPVIYAEALLQLEEQRSERLQLAMALKGHSGSLLSRVSQVLGEGMTMERTMTSGVRAAAVGAVILALFLGSRTASGLKPTQQKPVVVAGLKHAHAQQEIAAFATPFPALSAAPEAAPAPRVQTGPAPAPDPAPMPTISGPEPMPMPSPSPAPGESSHEQSSEVKTSGSDYIQKMHDAGYPLDLNKDLDRIVSMRSVGVTPEYARSMAQVGMGTPTLQELTNLKAQGISPEYLAGLHSSGIPPANFHEAISEKALGVTPEYAKSIATIGIGTPNVHDLISLKAQGVTPEYAAELKNSGIPVEDIHQLVSMKAVGVTPDFAKGMAAAGFTGLKGQDLISLRAQGVTAEYARWLKQTYPTADASSLRKGANFHIDAEFIARAKSHGFNDGSFDRLVKLKMSGLLD